LELPPFGYDASRQRLSASGTSRVEDGALKWRPSPVEVVTITGAYDAEHYLET